MKIFSFAFIAAPPRVSLFAPLANVLARACALACVANMPSFAAGAVMVPNQAAPSREGRSEPMPDAQTLRVQQRKDLRQALKAPQGKGEEAVVPIPVNRHLSAQERAEMRQQLRQQRMDTERQKP